MEDDKKWRKITFHCSEDFQERLDRLAAKGDIPRSKMILNMLEVTVAYCEITEKVGILQFNLLLRDAGDKLKEVAKKWKEKKSFSDIKA